MQEGNGEALLRLLALDLRWSWSHASDELWRKFDPELWARTHNPWVVLQSESPQHIAALWADAEFRGKVERLVATCQHPFTSPSV